MPSLTLRPPWLIEDYENLRRIRNECRGFMTGSMAWISTDDQRRFMDQTRRDILTLSPMVQVPIPDDRPVRAPYLARIEGNPVPVGYGVVTHRAGKIWLTGGLVTDYRGKGIGAALFTGMIEICRRRWPKREIWLEVLPTNTRAIRLYESLGFEETDRIGYAVTMRLPR